MDNLWLGLLLPFIMAMDGNWLPVMTVVANAIAAAMGAQSGVKRVERLLKVHIDDDRRHYPPSVERRFSP